MNNKPEQEKKGGGKKDLKGEIIGGIRYRGIYDLICEECGILYLSSPHRDLLEEWAKEHGWKISPSGLSAQCRRCIVAEEGEENP